MAKRTFVHVEVKELAEAGACLAVPTAKIDQLVSAGFVEATGKVGYVGVDGALLLKTPGAFVVRL